MVARAGFYTVVVGPDTLLNLFRRFGSGAYEPLQVALELLLIGLAVNWCAGALRGTRGTRLLRGLLVVLVAATLIVRVLAEQFGWARLGLLYQYFMVGLAFIALVAFQPELRRALIRAGDVPFLRRTAPERRLIAALVESAGYLSRNRYGALVAIQREVGLGNWAEHGTQLNAEVSANLLNSIFYPNSPLHDLGVIIQGQRVLAAGCQFPVAESGEVDPALGSRHRAAVGLSAESDALVLVVSEETGTISLADRGELTRFLSLDDLEEELQSRLAGRGDGGARAPRASTATDAWRMARRLAAVVPLTLVIWFLADQASLIDDTIRILLEPRSDPAVQVDMVDPQPSMFEVRVRGTTREVLTLKAGSADQPLRIAWMPEAAYAKPGRHTYRGDDLAGIVAALPPIQTRGLYVIKVSPEALSYVVEEVVTVTLPIRVESGPVRVADARLEPAEASVALRKSDLELIPEAQRQVTASLAETLRDVPAGQVRTFSRFRLDRRIAGYSVLRLSPEFADVTLQVVAQQVRRRLEERIAVQVLASPQFLQRFELEQRDANEWLIELEVEGDQARVAALQPKDTRAFVMFTLDQTPGADFRSAPVTVVLPQGVNLVGPPPEVQYRLLVRESATP